MERPLIIWNNEDLAQRIKATEMAGLNEPPKRMAGSLVWGQVIGNNIEMWFDSPTGDSSDVQYFYMHCVDNRQAEIIWGQHKKVWGI